jgi:hypothetical protein
MSMQPEHQPPTFGYECLPSDKQIPANGNTFDLESVLLSIRMLEQTRGGPPWGLIADRVLSVEAGIDETDIAGVNAPLWKATHDENRRVWEVFLNRLRRFGRDFKIQEEGIVVIDLATTPRLVNDLWMHFSLPPKTKRKKSKRGWQFLVHHPCRDDFKGGLKNLPQIPGFAISSSPATGLWGNISPPCGATWTSIFGRVVIELSAWFNLVLLATDEGLVRFTNPKAISLPNPLETEPFDVEVEIDRNKVIEAIRSLGAGIPNEALLRIFKYTMNVVGTSDGDFVPFESEIAQYTRSGTIFVGCGEWLFALNLRTWEATRVGRFDEKRVRCAAAKHFRHQRALHEVNAQGPVEGCMTHLLPPSNPNQI